MFHAESSGLLVGAVALGVVHGLEPGHGWPVAASYALDQSHKWLYGLAASLTIGIGHLVSSLAMVAVFFYAKTYFELTQINDPLIVAGGVEIGGPVSIIAGLLLILLGLREYRHDHAHEHSHDHEYSDDQSSQHGHGHSHETDDPGLWRRLRGALPGGSGQVDDAADRGLLGIAWFAFVLGFAHEEEFEIIALCAGSTHCLELMSAYALTVIAGIVALTLLLIGGYQRYERRVERYAPYLPVFSAVILTGMGVGFVVGVF